MNDGATNEAGTRHAGFGGRLSLPHLTMLDAAPPELIGAAADAGFHSVSLRLIPTMKGEAQHAMFGGSPMQRETKAVLAATGVTVYDIEALWLTADSDPRRYEREFEAAAELGGRCVQVIANDPVPDRLAATFARFCETGRSFGLAMALEFMRISELRSLESAREVLHAAGQPNAFLVIDALHCYRCDTSLEALRGLDPEIVGMIQLCDAPLRGPDSHAAMIEEARFDRRLPGEGELPLQAWLQALPRGKVLAIEAPLRPSRGQVLSPRQRARHLMQGLQSFLDGMAQADG